MNSLVLVPMGAVPNPLLGAVAYKLYHVIGWRCEIRRLPADPALAFHPERQQYHSTELLRHLLAITPDEPGKVVGVTPVDLYIPILKYVFGEAELGGRAAVVGYHRLREEFYGFPGNPKILGDRVAREVIHELGHTAGLPHCDDYSCVMASAHSVERLDLKQDHFCGRCLARFRTATALS